MDLEIEIINSLNFSKDALESINGSLIIENSTKSNINKIKVILMSIKGITDMIYQNAEDIKIIECAKIVLNKFKSKICASGN